MYLSAKPIRLTLLAAAIAAALPAHAQEAQPQAKADAAKDAPAPDAKMQKVEVRAEANNYDPRRDDTATKIVVNHDEIVKYGDTNVMDVLKRVPGVTVSGSGRGGEIRMRGLGAGYTQILINGERAPAGFSIDSLAPDVIERIEVLRAATAEFSTQSVAGTINIVLKRAIKTAQREVKLGIARSRELVNPTANLQLSDRAGKMSWSVAANAQYQEFERVAWTVEEGFDRQGAFRRNTSEPSDGHFANLNLSPRLNWNLEGGDTLTSQTFVNMNRFAGNLQNLISTPVGHAPTHSAIDARFSNEIIFVRTDLNWVHKLASGSRLDLKVGGSAGSFENAQERAGFNAAGARLLDSLTESDGKDRGVTSTGKYTNPLIEGHALALGWDAGYSTRDETRVQHDVVAGAAVPFHSDEQYEARVARVAAFVQDEWNVTPRWSVYLGVRWEGIETRSSGNTFDAARSRSSVWSPLVQTLWKLPNTKSDQVRFAVTRTYKAPDLQSLIPRRFTALNNSSTTPDFMGNPSLKPELALGFDAAYEHYWGEGALLSVSGSMRRIDNFPRVAVVEGTDGRWVAMPSNAGRAHTRGLEVEAKFPLKSVINTAQNIDLRASVSRNWSSVDSVPGPNNRLGNQTPLSATFGIDYKAGALTTGGSFAFRNGGPVRISEYQTSYQSVRRDLDVYALWKFNPKHQLRVALSNVLAQDFISAGSYTDSSSSVTRTSVYPANIIVRATMEMKF